MTLLSVEPREVYYRYEDFQMSHLNEWGEPCGGASHEIKLREFDVIKHTPKGVWIYVGWGKRFVLASATKQFACPTKEAAMVSFIARKRRQKGIYEARLHHIKMVLEKVQRKDFVPYGWRSSSLSRG